MFFGQNKKNYNINNVKLSNCRNSAILYIYIVNTEDKCTPNKMYSQRSNDGKWLKKIEFGIR